MRAIFDLLRTAPDGMTGAAPAEAIIVWKGWDAGDRVFRAALADKAGGALFKQATRGTVTATKGDGRENVWRLAAA